jgi:ABC-type Fe3+/spermidine/putrescine transport system ATPase subunit
MGGELHIPVVLVTHDIFEAYSMGDSMIVYSSGKVVQKGSPADIFHLPAGLEIETVLTVSSSK